MPMKFFLGLLVILAFMSLMAALSTSYKDRPNWGFGIALFLFGLAYASLLQWMTTSH